MYVYLFNWSVSPSLRLGGDLVKITASGEVLNLKAD
jgi:hypothetical protein